MCLKLCHPYGFSTNSHILSLLYDTRVPRQVPYYTLSWRDFDSFSRNWIYCTRIGIPLNYKYSSERNNALVHVVLEVPNMSKNIETPRRRRNSTFIRQPFQHHNVVLLPVPALDPVLGRNVPVAAGPAFWRCVADGIGCVRDPVITLLGAEPFGELLIACARLAVGVL